MTATALAARPRRSASSAQPPPRSVPSRTSPAGQHSVGAARGSLPVSKASSSAWGSTAGSCALAPVVSPVPGPLRETATLRHAFGRPVPAADAPSRPPSSVPSRTPSSATRLTRRGRLLATLTGTALVLLCLTLVPAVASGVASAFTVSPTIQTTTVTVQPGQTLWQVAATADPGGDTATVVARIADANGLTGAADVRPGQRLVVPLE